MLIEYQVHDLHKGHPNNYKYETKTQKLTSTILKCDHENDNLAIESEQLEEAKSSTNSTKSKADSKQIVTKACILQVYVLGIRAFKGIEYFVSRVHSVQIHRKSSP
jgi:hypothetical protein